MLAGRPLLIYFLFEHQSRPHAFMPLRLLRYMLRIWDAHLANHPGARRVPAILPVVLHHSESGWHAAIAFEELLDVDPDTLAALGDYVPRFRFVLEDVSLESDDALRARAMTALGRLVLWCFRHARAPDDLLQRLVGWRDVVREARRAPNGAAALSLVWRYILTINDPSRPEDLLRRLLHAAGAEAKEEIVSVADWLEERGRQKGRLEGQRSSLLKQLAIRFGELPDAVVRRIQDADAQQLDSWTERVITAPTLAEALGEG